MKTSLGFWRVSLTMLAGMSLVVGSKGQDPSDPAPPRMASPTNESKAVELAKPNAGPDAIAKVLAQGNTGPTGISISWLTGEIAKMAQSSVEPAVIKAYVENSTAAVPPTADEIIYLRNQGISSDTIASYIRRAQQLKAQAMASVQETQSPVTPVETSAPDYAGVPPAVYPESVPPAYPDTAYGYAGPTYVYAAPPAYLYPPPYYLGFSGSFYHPRAAINRFSRPGIGHIARPQPMVRPGRNNHSPNFRPGANQGNRVR